MAAIVGENDGTEDEVIAALLQDAPEDAGGEAQLTEIRARFGDGVADIVAGCTDTYEDPKPPWRTRKEDYLDHLAKAPSPVRRVSASPRRTRSSTTPAPCCRTTVLSDYRAVGEDLWGRFNGGRSGKLWYYRAVAVALAGGRPGRRRAGTHRHGAGARRGRSPVGRVESR